MNELNYPHIHEPHITDLGNGDKTWRFGKIAGHDVLVPSRFQVGGTCVSESITLSSYYRLRCHNLSMGMAPPAAMRDIVHVYNPGEGSSPRDVGDSAMNNGYIDSNGHRVRISQYQLREPIIDEMLDELENNGPFYVLRPQFTYDTFRRYHLGLYKVLTFPLDDSDERICNHCVTIIGHGELEGDFVWWAQDSYGNASNYIDGMKDGRMFLEHDMIKTVFYPYL